MQAWNIISLQRLCFKSVVSPPPHPLWIMQQLQMILNGHKGTKSRTYLQELFRRIKRRLHRHDYGLLLCENLSLYHHLFFQLTIQPVVESLIFKLFTSDVEFRGCFLDQLFCGNLTVVRKGFFTLKCILLNRSFPYARVKLFPSHQSHVNHHIINSST